MAARQRAAIGHEFENLASGNNEVGDTPKIPTFDLSGRSVAA
jgi:hypothetical protein